MLLRPGLDQIARTQANFEFDLERRVLSEDVGGATAAAPLQTVDDPFQLVLERYMQMGYEVLLQLTGVPLVFACVPTWSCTKVASCSLTS